MTTPIAKAVGKMFSGVCPECDQLFIAYATYFGDPMYEPEMTVRHLDTDRHSPTFTAGSRLTAGEYAEMHRRGWRQPLAPLDFS